MSRARAGERYLHRREKGTRREVVTPEGIPLGFTLAPAGDRAAAVLLDLVFIFVTVVVVVLASSLVAGGLASGYATALGLLVLFLVRNFYFTFFELRWQGSTPGKRIVGTRVVDRNGAPLSADAVIVRNLLREVEMWLPIFAILQPDLIVEGAPGWLKLVGTAWLFVFLFMPLFNKDRLRTGDMAAGTLVVLAPRPLLLPDLGGEEIDRKQVAESSFHFTDAQLDVYGIYELQVLEDVLRQGDGHAMDAVCERIKTKIQWDRAQWNVHSERFLREFYAALRARLEHRMLLGKRREDKYSK